MNLGGQEYTKKDDGLKKIIKAAIVFAVLALFVVLGVYMYVYYLDSQALKLSIDNKRATITEQTLIMDETGAVYVSIEEFAKLTGYEFYQGEYGKYTEDKSKCYIANKNEIAGFELGSNQIYKVDPNVTNANYEWYQMQEPVKMLNNKLYCLSDGIKVAYNVQFEYDKERNIIQVTTLDTLVNHYQAIAVNNYKYTGIDTAYANQKAVLYGMLVVKKAETDASGRVQEDTYKYGVVTLNNQNIIGTKYDKIEFIEVTQEFFVTSNNKVGILSNEGAQKVAPTYDAIEVLDNELRLYYVENDDMKGVLDRNGKRVVYIENEQIGVDASLFPSNDITNSMLLFDNCIPVMKNSKWGLFDKNGNQLLDTVYDSLGYIAGTQKDAVGNNLLIIPEIEGIVVCQNGKYGIVQSTGKFLAPCSFDKIYSITNLGEDTYYLTYGTQTITLEDYQKLSEQPTTTPQEIQQQPTTEAGDTSNETTTGNTIGNTVGNTVESTIVQNSGIQIVQ